jgi:hypothetical protein
MNFPLLNEMDLRLASAKFCDGEKGVYVYLRGVAVAVVLVG